MSADQKGKRFVLALDVGGTVTRAILLNEAGRVSDCTYVTTDTISGEEGMMEHDPEQLWQSVQSVIFSLIEKNSLVPGQISALGISVQRATFCLWEKDSGKPCTNFISWSDIRAAEQAYKMNRNPVWKLLQVGAGILSRITGSTFFMAASQLKFVTDHILTRLLWVFSNDPELYRRAKAGEILFGTIDTFLLHRLTGGRLHATDASNAAATSLYNPFDLKWNRLFCTIFSVPMCILPEVEDTAGDFGTVVLPELRKYSIPIRAVVGDQMSALFGHCCFTPGEVKISQGSGSFVDVNVGDRGKGSRRGLFPLVAWKLNGKATYMLEGSVATAGRLIDWLGQGIGLSDTPKVLNDFAAQTDDTNGVIFVPTPAGIRFPYFNPKARGTIFGLSLTTHRCHVARAVLEGIAHRIVDILEGITKDTHQRLIRVKVDGGVSQSDILLQLISDLSGYEVERAPEVDMTAVGVGFLAGLSAGMWNSFDELRGLGEPYRVFTPKIDPREREKRSKRWHAAVRTVVRMYK
ncbi:MAG: glycerol kinase 5 [Spirochaetota bacterium]